MKFTISLIHSPCFLSLPQQKYSIQHTTLNRRKCKFPNMINSITVAFKRVVIKDEVFPVSSSKQKLKY